MDELIKGTAVKLNGDDPKASVFAHPLPFNLIPHIDSFQVCYSLYLSTLTCILCTGTRKTYKQYHIIWVFCALCHFPTGKRLHEGGDESCVGDTKNLRVKSRRRKNLLHGGKGADPPGSFRSDYTGDCATRVCGQSKVRIVVCLGVVEVQRCASCLRYKE